MVIIADLHYHCLDIYEFCISKQRTVDVMTYIKRGIYNIVGVRF